MDASREVKAEQIFSEALHVSPDERRNFIESMCNDDRELLNRVQDLLRAYAHGQQILQSGPIGQQVGQALAEAFQSSSEERSSVVLPERLGDFDLLREIGRGGMGIVYEARQRSLKRRVALKVLPPSLGLSSEARPRFEREAQAAAQLHHTSIVPVYAIGEEAGHLFYAMELVDGEPLNKIIAEVKRSGSHPLMDETIARHSVESAPTSSKGSSRWPNAATGLDSATVSDTSSATRKWCNMIAQFIADVADGLHHAHGRGVIHRDIKPANLLLSRDGRLMITDFGLARIVQDPSLTVSGLLMGTLAYMSPEQIAAGRMDLDHRTDIYSLGAVLYELLTLSRPFPGKTREEIVHGILTRDAKSPRRVNPKIPLDLETICMKAMAKNPETRYATARHMAQDLRQHLVGGVISARRDGFLRRAFKATRRHPVATLLVAGLILSSVLAGLAWDARGRGIEEKILRLVAEAKLAAADGGNKEALELVDRALSLDPSRVESQLIRARLLMELGRTSEAVAEARSVLETDPGDWPAHAILAACANEILDIAKEDHVAAVDRLAPSTADSYYLRSLLATSDLEAIKLLNEALELDSGHARALEARALHHLCSQNPGQALRDAERLLASQPRSPQGRVLSARIYSSVHDYKRAIGEIEIALDMAPTDPRVYAERSEILAQHGRHMEPAISSASRAVELAPQNPEYLGRRAFLYYRFNETEKAIEDAKHCIKVAPASDAARQAYTVLIESYRRSGNRDEATRTLREFQSEIEKWTDGKLQAWGYQRACRWAINVLNDNSVALAAANQAIEADPDGWESYIARALVRRYTHENKLVDMDCGTSAEIKLQEPDEFLARGVMSYRICLNTEQALLDLDRAIDLAPNWAQPYSWRARLHQETGRMQEAEADMSKQVELAPKWAQAYYNRAELYVTLERYDDALRDLNHCIALGNEGYPSPIDAYSDKADVLARLGREEEALETIDSGLLENPRQAGFYSTKAVYLNWWGRTHEALAAFDSALALAPGNHYNYILRARAALELPNSCDRAIADLNRAKEATSNENVWRGVAVTQALYVFQECPHLYESDESFELAQKAVDVRPELPGSWSALGLVLYRHARYSEAYEAFLKVIEMESPTQDPSTLMCLALVTSRLGRGSEALAFFEQGVARQKTMHRYHYSYYMRLAQEAAQLLGVPGHTF